MTILKIGIIGCGRISGHHARAIKSQQSADLIAVCDLESAKSLQYAEEFGAKSYVNFRKMLEENPEINTVVIATPSGMHFEHAMEVIEQYKKNVIVEKPTFMTPEQVERAFNTAKKSGVQVIPIFQNRHNLAVQKVKSGLLNGELGQIRTISVRVRWCRPQRYYDLAQWRGTYALDGGALTNQGIHHIDLLRFLGGEVEKVCSVHKTLGADIEVEDTAVATLVFKNGAIGTLEITTSARPDDFEASISFICENGLAQIGGIAVNELQVYTPNPEECLNNSEDFSGNVYGNGHARIYEEIVLSLKRNSPYVVDFEDTHKTISLLNSFYVSDETGSWCDGSENIKSTRLGVANENLAALYRTVD
ncbi:MviM Predicted dehydrogenases and related proteins [Candidatus Nanopelagicaceae bacterium]